MKKNIEIPAVKKKELVSNTHERLIIGTISTAIFVGALALLGRDKEDIISYALGFSIADIIIAAWEYRKSKKAVIAEINNTQKIDD